ncbi:MAG: branched-chain amino acid ABC transporter permease [Candidatus Bathyarchaeia archaeon]|jgi:branched-chain amino acid transport system permease protein
MFIKSAPERKGRNNGSKHHCPLIINGLLIGGIYSLVSMGLTLIWRVMAIVNFAQGEFLMIAMYVAWIMFSALGLSPYLSVVVCPLSLFLIGLIIERFLISRVVELSMAARIYVTFGLSLFLVNFMLMLMGGDVRSIPSEVSTIVVSSVFADVHHLISFVFSIFTALGMYLFLKRTRIGKPYEQSARIELWPA